MAAFDALRDGVSEEDYEAMSVGDHATRSDRAFDATQ
jgi:hypothetical protein